MSGRQARWRRRARRAGFWAAFFQTAHLDGVSRWSKDFQRQHPVWADVKVRHIVSIGSVFTTRWEFGP